jgi:hypothetical protein
MFIIFDSILWIQYKNHYSEWIKDWKPHGFFFIPKEAKTFFGMPKFRSWIAMQRRCSTLCWKTPKWALKEPNVLKLIFAIEFWLSLVF